THPYSYNPPATPVIYTLSLHDALPISAPRPEALQHSAERRRPAARHRLWPGQADADGQRPDAVGSHPGHAQDDSRLRQAAVRLRSEEHTSELQSRSEFVCRLLLENNTL